MRVPTDADLRLCPDNVQEHIDRLTREHADLRAKLAAAEKDRDEQREAVRVLAEYVACVENGSPFRRVCEKQRQYENNPTAAAAVKEAGGGD